MNFPNKQIVEKIRQQYPKGTRVELIHMDDPYNKLPVKARGTVQSVDDIATIHVAWDCGSLLGIAYGADQCRRIMECPKCGQAYSTYPSISRRDNQTKICPECGLREALEDAGRSAEEITETINEIRNLGVQ